MAAECRQRLRQSYGNARGPRLDDASRGPRAPLGVEEPVSARQRQALADVDAVRVAVQARLVLAVQRLPAAAHVVARSDLAEGVTAAGHVGALGAAGHRRR